MAFSLCLPEINDLSGDGAVNELVRPDVTQLRPSPADRRPALIDIGLLDGLIAGLRDNGFMPVVFDGVLANPTDHVANAAHGMPGKQGGAIP